MAEKEEISFVTMTVEVSPREKTLLDAAARTCGQTVEEFTLKAATDAAAKALAT
ncbi:MAG TPA: DUF1778 domain-containing protein [Candidatus Saccharimonadales bacterium]|nr:DUF1778 domain-containing protein [Candidatus Saccharimonadales bacterium]